MKVYLLGCQDYELGIFSTKEKAQEAELFYAQLKELARKKEQFHILEH